MTHKNAPPGRKEHKENMKCMAAFLKWCIVLFVLEEVCLHSTSLGLAATTTVKLVLRGEVCAIQVTCYVLMLCVFPFVLGFFSRQNCLGFWQVFIL